VKIRGNFDISQRALPQKPKLPKSETTLPPTSTVNRGKAVVLTTLPKERKVQVQGATLCFGDALDLYPMWERPDVIVSDGGYGILGFEGDTADHMGLDLWYEPHVEAWARHAKFGTALWFWNSEIGWAATHPVLERHGWRYVNANIWNKGKGHIAGNVNTQKIRRFPVVSEMCVQYVREVTVGGDSLKVWLKAEWQRAGLALRLANTACGVRDAAVRKYFDQGHLWYWPPAEMFARLAAYANEHGDPAGRPYYSFDGRRPLTEDEWAATRSKFRCPHGFTNVWDRNALRGSERVRIGTNGKAVHLNQKPLDLISMIIAASSDSGDVVWEPFGGMFTASVASSRLGRRSFAAEIDSTYFQYGSRRVREDFAQPSLLMPK
jgi:DNA modification methylase